MNGARITMVYLRESEASDTGLELVVAFEGGTTTAKPLSVDGRSEMLRLIAASYDRRRN